MNETIRRFGHPDTLIANYDHWVVLLRPAQPTLGSLVLAAKGEARSFSTLAAPAFAELGSVVAGIEGALKQAIGYEKINYLMLMMVDPHVHFHVFPRYLGARTLEDVTISDAGWPGVPDLKSAPDLDGKTLDRLRNRFQQSWLTFD